MDAARLLLILSGDAAGAVAAVGETDAALGTLKDSAAESDKSLAGVGATLLKVGEVVGLLGTVVAAVSTKMAADFQAGTTRLITNAGETRDSVDNVIAPALLRLAVAAGYSTGQLIEGFRQVSSAGFKSADGVHVLTIAAEAARAENADLGVVLNAVTSILNAYGLKASDTTMVVNTLTAAMQSGKLTLQDIAANLGTVVPAASQANVSIQELTSALAVMANEGIKPANAATYLRFTILNLLEPTGKAQSAIQDLGLDAMELSKTLTTKGLQAAIEELEENVARKFPESAAALRAEFAKVKAGTEDLDTAVGNLTQGNYRGMDAIAAITGGIRGMQGVLALGGEHLKVFDENTRQITRTVKEAGDKIIGWDQIQGNFNFKLSQAREVVEVLGIKLGTVLLPYSTQVAQAFVNAQPKLEAFATAVGTIFDAIAGTLSGNYSVAGGTFLVLWKALGVDPKTAAEVSDNVQTVFDNIGKAVRGAIPVIQAIVNTAREMLPTFLLIAVTASNVLGPAFQFLGQHGDLISRIFQLWIGLKVAVWFKGIADAGISAFQALMSSSFMAQVRVVAGWLAAQAQVVAGWVATQARIVAGWAAQAAQDAVFMARYTTGWLAAQARVVAGWLAAQVKIVASWIATEAQATATWIAQEAQNVAFAARYLATWLAAQAQVVAGWVATGARTVATFVATAAAATAQTAIMIARFVAAQVALLAIRAATLLWAAAQWILNVALTANPIGLVIVAVAALVAGVIWAYNNVGWFRQQVDILWAAFKAFAGWVQSTLVPALEGIAKKAQEVGSALQSINPFAQHSPSLVMNVEAGTEVISQRYVRMAAEIRSSTAAALTGALTASRALSDRTTSETAVAGAGPTSDRTEQLLEGIHSELRAIRTGAPSLGSQAASLRHA